MEIVASNDGTPPVKAEIVPAVPAPRLAEAASTPPLVSSTQRTILFSLAAVLFASIAIFALVAYERESQFYSQILDHARDASACAENAMLFEAALAPFRNLAMVRTAALFLSFVLVLLGSLFVLTGIEAAYRINVESGAQKATLETASPGLVLATAGAMLMAASLYRGGSPEFSPSDCGAAHRAADKAQIDLKSLKETQP